jgi:hypothetical protein
LKRGNVLQVTTEACLESKELNCEDMKSKVERREVPTEEATVNSSGTMKKQHRGWHLVARRKELTQGGYGSQRNLAATCRKVSHQVAVARHRRNVFREIVDLRRNWPQLGGRSILL